MHFSLSVGLAAVTLAVAFLPANAPAQNPSALATSWDVRRFGAVGDGKTDCAPAFQQAVDAAAKGLTKTVFVPPGRFLLKRPIFVEGTGVKVSGAGDESNVVVFGVHPAFVFGVRKVEKGGRVVEAGHRPDVAGKLDSSVNAEPGQRRGFATLGKVFLTSVAHPAQLGARTGRTDDRCFDYWGEMKAFTIEACLEQQPGMPWTPWAPLAGIGQVHIEPGPWFLSVGEDVQTLVFGYKTSDMPEEVDTGDRKIMIPLAGAKPPYKVRVTVDFETGKIGASVNERPVTDSVSDRNTRRKPWKAGIRFLHSRARHPFLVGAEGACPDLNGGKVTPFRLYGLRVSRVARGKPSDDAEAYLGNDAHTIFYLPLTGEPGRTIDLSGGLAADGQTGTAMLLHGDGYLGGIDSNAVTDLSIQGGSPGILLGGVRRFRVERVRTEGGMVGLASLPMVASYPITIRDCEFSGFDAAVSLWRCEVRASGPRP